MDLVSVLIRASLLFLVGLPLIAAAVGTVVSAIALVQRGPAGGVWAALLIFAALSAVLAGVMARVWRRPLLQSSPGAPPLPEPWRRRLTLMVLAITYLVLGFGALLITGGFSPGWLGAILIVFSVVTVATGVGANRQIRGRPSPAPTDIERVDRAINRNSALLRLLLVITPVNIALFLAAYRFSDLGRVLSVLDALGITMFLSLPVLSIWLARQGLRSARQASREAV